MPVFVTHADFTFSFRVPEASHWGTAASWNSAKSISNLSKEKKEYVFPVQAAAGNKKLISEKKKTTNLNCADQEGLVGMRLEVHAHVAYTESHIQCCLWYTFRLGLNVRVSVQVRVRVLVVKLALG